MIHQNVHKDATLHTDELPAYRKIGKGYRAHKTVIQSLGEYASEDAHCNSAESFFALLKRGVHSIFQHVSKKHLHRYCDEFAFRWEHKKVTDGVRTEWAIHGVEGKRLQYRAAKASRVKQLALK